MGNAVFLEQIQEFLLNGQLAMLLLLAVDKSELTEPPSAARECQPERGHFPVVANQQDVAG